MTGEEKFRSWQAFSIVAKKVVRNFPPFAMQGVKGRPSDQTKNWRQTPLTLSPLEADAQKSVHGEASSLHHTTKNNVISAV